MIHQANAVSQAVSEDTLFSAFDQLAAQPLHQETIAVYDAEAAASMTYG